MSDIINGEMNFGISIDGAIDYAEAISGSIAHLTVWTAGDVHLEDAGNILLEDGDQLKIEVV